MAESRSICKFFTAPSLPADTLPADTLRDRLVLNSTSSQSFAGGSFADDSLEEQLSPLRRCLPFPVAVTSIENEVLDPGKYLPPGERLVCEVFPSQRRKLQFQNGRIALRKAYNRMCSPVPGLPEITVLPDGRPNLPPHIRGSLSHAASAAIAVVALSRDVQGLGIDIELIRPLYDAKKLIRRVSPHGLGSIEVSYVAKAVDRFEIALADGGYPESNRISRETLEALALFSLKEAAFKAMTNALYRCPVENPYDRDTLREMHEPIHLNTFSLTGMLEETMAAAPEETVHPFRGVAVNQCTGTRIFIVQFLYHSSYIASLAYVLREAS